MTDYGTEGRQRFLRQCRYLAALRALYVGLCILSVGGMLAAIVISLARKP